MKDTSAPSHHQVLSRGWAVFVCSLVSFPDRLLGWLLVLLATAVMLRLDEKETGG